MHNKFQGKSVSNIQWLPDGSAFTFTRQNEKTGSLDIYRHDVKSGEEVLVLQGNSLRYMGRPVFMSAYKTTSKNQHLLITGKQKQIWRHSYSAPYYLYNMTDKTILALVKEDTLRIGVKRDGEDEVVSIPLSEMKRDENTADLLQLQIEPEMPVLIYQLTKDGPAHRAGLLPDDQIVSVNGVPATCRRDIRAHPKKEHTRSSFLEEMVGAAGIEPATPAV